MLPFDIASLWSRKKIRGGVHPEPRKGATADQTIDTAFPLPKMLYLPLQQHVGQPAEPVVKVGERVLKGQLLAGSQGKISAPIHAPTSGIILDIMDYPAAHPSALPTPTLLLEPDGEDQWIEGIGEIDPFSLSPAEIADRVGAAGVVGMGGAAFPSAVKLNLGRKTRIQTLLINGGECEPYLTCDDRLMRERAADIVDGIRIMLRALECRHAIVGIEDNKPEAYDTMREAAKGFGQIEITLVPSLYPMGWDKQLIGYLTDKEVPAGGRSADVGVLMHNVGTAYAIQQAIRFNKPLVSRVITVSGEAVAAPRNVEAPIGTPLADLLAYCGHQSGATARYVMGGPMMGDLLPHANVPLVKGATGILALTEGEVAASDAKACIRCSRCVSACPAGLLPLEMMTRIRAGQLEGAVNYGLKDCISCGSCSYVCPSQIPLVHYFKYASGELVARQQAQHKSEQTKKLAEEKQARIDRYKQEQAAAAAARKAAREQQQKKKTEEAA
ncbi:electron transport complex subunit RsxC [Methyloterricola oryzae]|uniref:electron transport complex subunit RsxC n=1 Tax=Methyloterricola oryzae TaxID=1495050 RepID=UPI0005EB35E4|nr:electron transport complex subunit RsxC [Methyloterricola oryzae]